MKNREGLSKKIRFEVFKRDKFTCQYCGAKSPEVVLNVDHIDPVANGGTNEILNLITSCFSCNSGKSDRTLSDTSVVEKQRKQLELLQERREQIELMLEWKKSLSSFDSDVIEMVVDYMNSKIAPLCLNDNGKQSVSEWLKKFDVDKILDAVDISAKQYLKYENGQLDKESAELFLSKIGGVMVVKNLPPVKQKMAYIKGIARNRLSYWDDKKGSIILSNYIKELEQHYDEEQLLADLENEVTKLTKNAKNWSEWKNTIEKWTSDIQNWEKKSTPNNETKKLSDTEYSHEQLESFVAHGTYEQNDAIKALEHIATIFPKYDNQKFRETLNSRLIEFLSFNNDLERGYTDYSEAREYISEQILYLQLLDFFAYDEYEEENLGVLIVLEPILNELLVDIFMSCYYPTRSLKKEYLKIMIEMNINELKKNNNA
jgi:hypothetical protein